MQKAINNKEGMQEMGTLEQNVEFITNPDPRCPCLFLLDTSRSMAGTRINELNNAMLTFWESIRQDNLHGVDVRLQLSPLGTEEHKYYKTSSQPTRLRSLFFVLVELHL